MKRILSKLIYIFVIIIFSTIFFLSFLFDSNTFYSQNKFMSLIMCCFIMIIWYLIFKILNKTIKEKIDKKWHILILIIYFSIVTLLQYFVLKKLMVSPGWDYRVVFENAKHYVIHGNRYKAGYKEYFQLYPNNIMLFYILTKVISVGNLFHMSELRSCVLFNIVIIDFALLLLYVFLNKKYNSRIGIFGLIISLFFLPLYFYTPVFYSDTFSLFIVILFALIFTFVDNKNTLSKNNYIVFSLLGILLFLAKEIKITSTFIFIAIIIAYLFKNKDVKKIINIIITISVFIVLTFIFKITVVNNTKYAFKVNNYGNVPYTHWIMMGVEDIKADNSGRTCYGGYNEEDFQKSISFKTNEETFNYNVFEIKRRIKNMGLIGYPIYLSKKAVNAWSDGLYYSDSLLSRNQKYLSGKTYNYLFVNEKTKYILINFCQGVQFSFLISLIILSIIRIRNKDEEINYIMLSFLGLFLFLLFWENRSRYLFNYILLFIYIICEFYNEIYKKRIVFIKK